MGFFTPEAVIIGALVGLAYSFNLHRIPRLTLDYFAMKRLMHYAHFDIVEFLQLNAEGGPRAVIMPMSKKLSEVGILLAIRTRRRLEVLQRRELPPMTVEEYDANITSLDAYCAAAEALFGRVSVLRWYPGDELGRGVDAESDAVFHAINSDWDEFKRHSDFLASFSHRYSSIPNETVTPKAGE